MGLGTLFLFGDNQRALPCRPYLSDFPGKFLGITQPLLHGLVSDFVQSQESSRELLNEAATGFCFPLAHKSGSLEAV